MYGYCAHSVVLTLLECALEVSLHECLKVLIFHLTWLPCPFWWMKTCLVEKGIHLYKCSKLWLVMYGYKMHAWVWLSRDRLGEGSHLTCSIFVERVFYYTLALPLDAPCLSTECSVRHLFNLSWLVESDQSLASIVVDIPLGGLGLGAGVAGNSTVMVPSEWDQLSQAVIRVPTAHDTDVVQPLSPGAATMLTFPTRRRGPCGPSTTSSTTRSWRGFSSSPASQWGEGPLNLLFI